MKAKTLKALAVLLVATLFTGCGEKMSLLFKIETGDKIKIELDTSRGHELKQKDGMFYIDDINNQTIICGFFVTEDSYKAYIEALSLPGVTIHEEKVENMCSYIFYEMAGDTHIENNYIIWIGNSNTGAILTSTKEKETVEAVFDLLTISHL